MTGNITDFTGSTPELLKLAIVFKIFIEERGITAPAADVFALLYRYCYPKGQAIHYEPNVVSREIPKFGTALRRGGMIIGTPAPISKEILLNVGLVCLRSLLSEFKPQNTKFLGSIPGFMENSDSNLSRKHLENLSSAAKRASDLKLGPRIDGIGDYIDALLGLHADIIPEMPSWHDELLQNFVVSFFYNYSLPVDRSPKLPLKNVPYYDFYSTNITPFYLNLDKHPFLSPYNYDAYVTDSLVLADNDANIHNRILMNFCLLKKKKMISPYNCMGDPEPHKDANDKVTVPGLTLNYDYSGFSPETASRFKGIICEHCYRNANIPHILINNYLDYFWGETYYLSVTKEHGWYASPIRDVPSKYTKYSVKPGTDPGNVAFTLWQAGLYDTLNQVLATLGNRFDISFAKEITIRPGVSLNNIIKNSSI